MKCTCGHPEHYNTAIDNGLCNMCIADRLELLEFVEGLCPTTMETAKKMLEEERLQVGDKP